MTTAQRDLAAHEYWERSLARSRYRRALAASVRRGHKRRKGVSAVVAAATMAGPGTPMAFAAVSGNLQAEVAAETPSKRAIEIREGGLPLELGSQGPLVAQVQKALQIPADGIFGPQTDDAVRRYQARAGMHVDGIVGPLTWASLFERPSAVGATNVPPQVRQRLERELREAGERLDTRARESTRDLFGSGDEAAPPAGGEGSDPASPEESDPAEGSDPAPPVDGGGQERSAPVGTSCGSSTVASPVNGTVTSGFGPRWGRNHDGLDIAAPAGTAIRAAACGSVTIAGTQSGYGNMVCITHNSSFSTCYAHMSRFAVSQGAQVRQGQVIGYVGCTGSCTGPHVHFETRVNGQAQDPRGYLDGAVPGGSAAAAAAATGAAGGPGGATTTAQGGATASGGSAAAATGAAQAEWTPADGGASAPADVAAAVPAEVVAGVPVEPAATAAPVQPAPVPVEPAPVPVEPAPVPVEPAPVPGRAGACARSSRRPCPSSLRPCPSSRRLCPSSRRLSRPSPLPRRSSRRRSRWSPSPSLPRRRLRALRQRQQPRRSKPLRWLRKPRRPRAACRPRRQLRKRPLSS